MPTCPTGPRPRRARPAAAPSRPSPAGKFPAGAATDGHTPRPWRKVAAFSSKDLLEQPQEPGRVGPYRGPHDQHNGQVPALPDSLVLSVAIVQVGVVRVAAPRLAQLAPAGLFVHRGREADGPRAGCWGDEEPQVVTGG